MSASSGSTTNRRPTIETAAKVNSVNESIRLDDDFVVWNFNQGCADVSVALVSPDNKKSFLSSYDPSVCDSEKSLINLHSIKEETPYVDRDTAAKEVLGNYV